MQDEVKERRLTMITSEDDGKRRLLMVAGGDVYVCSRRCVLMFDDHDVSECSVATQ